MVANLTRQRQNGQPRVIQRLPQRPLASLGNIKELLRTQRIATRTRVKVAPFSLVRIVGAAATERADAVMPCPDRLQGDVRHHLRPNNETGTDSIRTATPG